MSTASDTLVQQRSASRHQRVDALRHKLADAVQRRGAIDVGYVVVDSPAGPLLLAATDVGLVRVAFQVQGHEDALQDMAAVIGARVMQADDMLAPIARQVSEFFAGERHDFDIPVDWRRPSGFRLDVLRHLTTIGYGRTESYGQVARATGRDGAARAVGTACATNPVPLVVPCHRVVRSDGASGPYAGGAAVKQLLLQLESV